MRGRSGSLGYIIGFVVCAVATATCSDLSAPAGLKGGVTIAYAGPPEAIGGAIQVTVGQKLSPAFQVSVGGNPQPRARYALSLGKPEDASVLRIFGSGNDSVEVVGRGSATLVATLLVETVGPDTAHRASITVIATTASITNVTPAKAVQGQRSVAVTVTGSNFVSGTIVDFGANITVSNLAVVNATRLTATLAVAAGATTGPRKVIVTNAATGGGADTLTNGFTVTAPAAPTMSLLLSPASGNQGATLTVAIDGSNFYSGVTTFDFGDGITVNSVSVISSTQASANITIGAAAALGPRSVTVTNTPTGGSQTQLLAFTVWP